MPRNIPSVGPGRCRPETSLAMKSGDQETAEDERPITSFAFSRNGPETALNAHIVGTRRSGAITPRTCFALKNKSSHYKLNLAIELFFNKQYRQAYPLFDEAAKSKDIVAMYHKAVMIFDGLGTIESPREGLLTFKRVYEQCSRYGGDPEYKHLSCYQIGLAHSSGTGARQDHREAARWWLKAANEVKYDPNSEVSVENQLITDAGTKCQIMLGHYYSRPYPAPDHEVALFWYKEAAQNGSVESMLQVGLMAWYGLGISPEDRYRDETIRKFLGQAAEAGNVCAMANLAMYSLETQVQDKAFLWASKVIATVTEMETGTTLGSAVLTILSSPNNDNTEDGITKSIAMSYFVLAHLHNVGAVATLDKEKAQEFYETACSIDIFLVQALSDFLESEDKLT